ncbi:hypothetical protein [Bradyrhizobium sp. JR3.5]
MLNDASGPNLFEWKSISGDDVFGDKRIALFAGAFTPAFSKANLPGYERHYEDFKQLGKITGSLER